MAMIFLQLLCAHVVADFYLQSYKMCVCKMQLLTGKGWICQIGHAFVHGLLAYIFVSDWKNWLLPLLVFVSHLIIDVLKDICLSKIQYKPNDIRSNWECVLFFIDQALHILVIWILLKYVDIAGQTVMCCNILDTKVLSCIIAYLIVLKPTSILIGKFTQRWQSVLLESEGLYDAGMWIGYAERVLALTFMLLGTYEALGFLIAAKSLLRFQETDTKRTEYVLIGTLLSFGVAVLVGVIINSEGTIENMVNNLLI